MNLNLSIYRRRLFSQEGFLLFTTITGYAFAYVYLLIMGRMLGAEEFGILGALFAIFYIAALFGQALREAIATSVAEIRAKQGEQASIAAFTSLGAKMGIICLVPCLVLFIAARPIADFFHLGSIWPVIIVSFSVFTALALDVLLGLLQGLQLFKALGISGYTVSQGLKVVFGLVLVWVGWGLIGSVASLVFSTGLAFVLGLGFIKKELVEAMKNPGVKLKLGPILLPTVTLAVFLSMPASVDVMLVTHFFGGVEAGLYNAVATLGKVVIFLPMAITMILLPRATEKHALGKHTGSILFQSLGITLVLSGTVALLFWAFPGFAVRFFFGDEYLEAVSLIGLYGAAMLLFSINVVLVHYSLAVRNLWLIAFADMVTLAEIGSILMFHQSLSQVIWILLYGNLVIIVFCLPYLALKNMAGAPGRKIFKIVETRFIERSKNRRRREVANVARKRLY